MSNSQPRYTTVVRLDSGCQGSSLTATGMTPAYIAPEQVTGEGSDHRADIYARGVMAYELVVSKQSLDAPTPTAALMKRLGPPLDPVGRVRANVPKDLEDAIRGCRAPDPAERCAGPGRA